MLIFFLKGVYIEPSADNAGHTHVCGGRKMSARSQSREFVLAEPGVHWLADAGTQKKRYTCASLI